jgi:hypothetical protein
MLTKACSALTVVCLLCSSMLSSVAGAQILTAHSVTTIEAALPDGGAWVCNSPGGDLLAGMALGIYLREHNVGVEIREGGWCASAAAVAALGAPRLFKSTFGHLVFHSPSRPLTVPERIVVESLLQRWNVPSPIVVRIIGLQLDEAWEPDGPVIGPLLASRR